MYAIRQKAMANAEKKGFRVSNHPCTTAATTKFASHYVGKQQQQHQHRQ
jgi:hypothetical protein